MLHNVISTWAYLHITVRNKFAWIFFFNVVFGVADLSVKITSLCELLITGMLLFFGSKKNLGWFAVCLHMLIRNYFSCDIG